MRGTACSPRRLFGLICGLAVVLLAQVMASAASAADYIPANQPIPQSVRVVGTNAAGANTVVGTKLPSVYGGGHTNIPVTVGGSSVAQAAKKYLGRALPYVGWAMTLRDIINGAGWAIDELQNQVVVPGQSAEPLPSEGAWCIVFQSNGNFPITGTRCTGTQGGVGAMFANVTGWTVESTEVESSTTVRVRFYRPGNNYTNSIVATYRTFETPPLPEWNGNPSQDAVPVTDQQLWDVLRNHPQVVQAVLIDPDTGAPVRTPELVAAMNDLRQALEAANGAAPGPDLPVDPNWSDPNTGTPNQTDWPAFCGWAPSVCEFMDWANAPEPEVERPEVPWDEEPPEEVQWSSGLGSGQCPAAHQFTVTFLGQSASPTFEYEPICSFAGIMRPVVLALASIGGVVILAGLRESKNA